MLLRGLRKLRGVSVKGFCAVADVVIGGLVGYYGSTDYLSWEDAEKIEGCFRKEFNSRFGRAHSSARLPLYVPYMGRRPLRTHAHATAAAALYETVTAAASDEQDTVVRRAARSAIARAMQVWGCAQDPLTWQWSGPSRLSSVCYALRVAVVVAAAYRVLGAVAVSAPGALIADGVLVHRRRPHRLAFTSVRSCASDAEDREEEDDMRLGQKQIGNHPRVPIETSKGDPNKKKKSGVDKL